MAHSLSSECTPLKQTYDTCFNAWFEGYLQPAVNPASGPSGLSKEERAKRNRQKAEEYEAKCGEAWRGYKACLEKAVQANGLTTLLKDARRDNPLTNPLPTPSNSLS
ncbi:hypothetical protein FRC03_000224 [Tulasnella sp. 419]|nr:hypothetical protein FRC03_000224 [Tulasnella sp. 419]